MTKDQIITKLTTKKVALETKLQAYQEEMDSERKQFAQVMAQINSRELDASSPITTIPKIQTVERSSPGVKAEPNMLVLDRMIKTGEQGIRQLRP